MGGRDLGVPRGHSPIVDMIVQTMGAGASTRTSPAPTTGAFDLSRPRARCPGPRTAAIHTTAGSGLAGALTRDPAASDDARRVDTDPAARYFGVPVARDTLVPQGDARLGAVTLHEWLGRSR